MVHFACHGFSDAANPLNSHILLQKNEASGLGVDKLMLSVLLEVTRHGNAFTAFLSACSTAEVRATDLVDESIHIASAFRIADFRHVIGSLWPANDDVCVQLASSFYRFLDTNQDKIDLDRRVAIALQGAVRELRDKYPGNPTLWAP
jgi:CHAT domain-containing protein